MSSELALILFIMNVSMFLLVQYLQEKKMKYKITYPIQTANAISYKDLKDIIKSLKETNRNLPLKIKLEKYKKNHQGASDEEIITYLKQEKKMNIETKLIKCKTELDKIALRDPITVQQVSIRKLWERVRSILVRRYKRLEDQEKKMKKYESKEKLLEELKNINHNYLQVYV